MFLDVKTFDCPWADIFRIMPATLANPVARAIGIGSVYIVNAERFFAKVWAVEPDEPNELWKKESKRVRPIKKRYICIQ